MRRAERAITARSVLLGLLLAAGLAAITPYNDYVIGNTCIAGNHFPIGAVAVLLLLSLAYLGFHRLRGHALRLDHRDRAIESDRAHLR